MRRLLLTISPLALLLALSAPALAQNGPSGKGDSTDKADSRADRTRDIARDASRDRSGDRRDGGRSEARDNSRDNDRQRDRADNTRDRDRDVTGAIGDRDHDRDRDRDRDRGRDRDRDRGGWGHEGHGHRDRDTDRHHDHTDALDRAWLRGDSPANPNAALLQQLIDENRADIAQAYQQYRLTNDRQMHRYLRQLISSREEQIQRLQARLNALN